MKASRVPVRDIVDEAIEDAMRQRVEVVVVDDVAMAGKLDGLGAVLRFQSSARPKAAPAAASRSRSRARARR